MWLLRRRTRWYVEGGGPCADSDRQPFGEPITQEPPCAALIRTTAETRLNEVRDERRKSSERLRNALITAGRVRASQDLCKSGAGRPVQSRQHRVHPSTGSESTSRVHEHGGGASDPPGVAEVISEGEMSSSPEDSFIQLKLHKTRCNQWIYHGASHTKRKQRHSGMVDATAFKRQRDLVLKRLQARSAQSHRARSGFVWWLASRNARVGYDPLTCLPRHQTQDEISDGDADSVDGKSSRAASIAASPRASEIATALQLPERAFLLRRRTTVRSMTLPFARVFSSDDDTSDDEAFSDLRATHRDASLRRKEAKGSDVPASVSIRRGGTTTEPAIRRQPTQG